VDNPTDNVGKYTSVGIGTDGLPVIGYYDSTAGTLRVAHCSTDTCSSSTITTVDNPSDDVGRHVSLAIGLNGVPVLAYQDFTSGALRVAACTNASCSTHFIFNVVTGSDAGFNTSIAVPFDGKPVIAYYDTLDLALKFVKCGDEACSGSNTLTTLDDPSGGDAGGYPSVAIGLDGFPVISYHDHIDGSLKMIKCGNAKCTADNVGNTIYNPSNNVGLWTSLAIGTDGLPVIAYQDASLNALQVAHLPNELGLSKWWRRG